MCTLWRASLAAALGLGISTLPLRSARSDDSRSETSWLGWLVKPPALESVRLVERPGRVIVWGGTFGRSPSVVHEIGDDIVKVAVGDGVGAAVDSKGEVIAFRVTDKKRIIERIPLKMRAADVAVRDGAAEIVILDTGGRVCTTTFDDRAEPVQMLKGAMRRVKRVRCGGEHCIAVTERGEAFSWGKSNSHGQLGRGRVGESDDRPGRVELPKGIRVIDAACGSRHSLFLDDMGDVYSVGDDQWAQLGISAEPWLKSHTKACAQVRKAGLVGGLAGLAIAGGGRHSVMLVRDGTVFSFGFNQWGQLGHHNYSSLAPPSPVADVEMRAVAIAAGENHTCVVKDNGQLWCIGGNEKGQLGVGNLQPSMTWKKVRVGKKGVKASFLYSSKWCTAAVIAPESLGLSVA